MAWSRDDMARFRDGTVQPRDVATRRVVAAEQGAPRVDGVRGRSMTYGELRALVDGDAAPTPARAATAALQQPIGGRARAGGLRVGEMGAMPLLRQT